MKDHFFYVVIVCLLLCVACGGSIEEDERDMLPVEENWQDNYLVRYKLGGFSNVTPMIDQDRFQSGCSSVSCTLLVKYWGHDVLVNLIDIDRYITETEKIKIDYDYAKYDFLNFSELNRILSSTYNSNYDDVLKFAIGIRLKADYSSDSSGVWQSEVVPFLEDVGLSGGDGYWFECDETDCFEVIEHDIDSDLPLYASLKDNKGFHAVIIDGYYQGKIHINFGYNGHLDGWYSEQDLQEIGYYLNRILAGISPYQVNDYFYLKNNPIYFLTKNKSEKKDFKM